MTPTILDRVSAKLLSSKPFPHLHLANALPMAYYDALEAALPEVDEASYNNADAIPTRNQHEKMLWREFWEAHASTDLATSLFNHFRGHVAQVPARAEVELWISRERYLPGQQASRPHVHKVGPVAYGFLYFPFRSGELNKGGELQFFTGGVNLVEERKTVRNAKPVVTVPYEANRAAFFVNTLSSIHAVRPRSRRDLPRRNILITWYREGA